MKIGDFVRFCRTDGGGSTFGNVRKLTPRQIVVWFGDTGFGQKEWPFNAKGEPIGPTKEMFPTGRLDLSWVDPFERKWEDK